MEDSLLPGREVCRAIELAEARSAFSQHACAPADEARRLGLHSEQYGAAVAVLTRRSENLIYNRLLGYGQRSPGTERQLERFEAAASELAVRRVAVPLGEATRPWSVVEWLQRRGYRRGHPAAKLWRDGAALSPWRGAPDVRVRRVKRSDASEWVDVVSQVWRAFGSRRPWFEARIGTAGWRHYLAWVDDRPVAAGALFVADLGSKRVGHLVDGVTLRPWRRRGAQAAMIRRRISDGRALGCELFTSETAPPLPRMPLVSFRNLRRQGFELAYLRYPWIRNL